jgi:hypothetical protein
MESEAKLEPVLEPLVQHTPRLLHAERLPLPGVRNPARSAGLILTLEVGRLWIRPGEQPGELAIALRDPRETPPPEAVSADEDDPWWALLGTELRHAWARPEPTGGVAAIELQFRPDHANPKIVALALQNGELHVSARAKHPSATR